MSSSWKPCKPCCGGVHCLGDHLKSIGRPSGRMVRPHFWVYAEPHGTTSLPAAKPADSPSTTVSNLFGSLRRPRKSFEAQYFDIGPGANST
eukprot:1139113-Pelagomonas_calceolata.AAC.5